MVLLFGFNWFRLNFMHQQPEFFLSKESFRNWVEGKNEDDCRFWDRWFSENPDQLPLAIEAARIFSGIPNQVDSLDSLAINQGWADVERRIDKHEGMKQRFSLSFSRIAATVGLFISALASWYVFQPVTESYATGYSNRSSVFLSDGTEIMMNANTRVSARRSWRFAPPREVWVDGEAYFIVKPLDDGKEKRDFIVHTHDMDITVTGTQFNVNTRSRGTRVFLSEGKVHVALKESPSRRVMHLQPGEVVSYSGMQDPLAAKKEISSPESQLAWKSGYFSFHETPLSEVVEMVYQTHGVRISVEDSSLLGETISGRVPNNNVDELVKSVSKLFNLKHTRNGTGIRLWK